jgi:hypothetical protein
MTGAHFRRMRDGHGGSSCNDLICNSYLGNLICKGELVAEAFWGLPTIVSL